MYRTVYKGTELLDFTNIYFGVSLFLTITTSKLSGNLEAEHAVLFKLLYTSSTREV